MNLCASHAVLDAARKLGDEPLDVCVARLGREVWAVHSALEGVRSNRETLPDCLPSELRDFLRAHVTVPVWLNRARILNAQAWAERHLLHITAALFCASLPSAYAADRGARVLMATQRMTTDLDRRVNETARFVLTMLEPSSFEPDGAALPAIRKVRLVHAAVRLHVRDRPELEGEAPINQEDLLGTLLSFSVLVVKSLRRMGVDVHPTDAEDFYHLWRGVGAMLGVNEDLMPLDFASACEVAERITERQFRPSPHGQLLMAELLRRTEAHFDLPLLRAAPGMLVRHLLGDRTADLLGVPAAPASDASFARAAQASFARWSKRALWSHLAPRLARTLLDAVVSVKLTRVRRASARPRF
jgi:hypothetical protein